jgi:HAD superfamily hydrolase (TIGR01509 family)
MATAIVMPQVGQDIKTGLVVEWCVKEGDHIEKGDVVAVVESDKATFEVEAYESGILLKILHDAGAEVPVLDPIAYLGEPGEEIEHRAEAVPAGEDIVQEAGSNRSGHASEHARQQRGNKAAVSPAARRLAEQYGIDPSKIVGTGPRGRVTRDDVLGAIAAKGAQNDARSSTTAVRQVGLKAVIFDCDGVLADTERDGHRVAFNRAFAEKGLDIVWDVALYGELLKIAGGKERMRHYFDDTGCPAEVDDRDAFIKELHKLKTDLYMKIIASGELPLRPGVARLVDEAAASDIALAVCSTSNERAVNLVVERLLGAERKARFAVVLAGDVVSKKKPDPEIYNLALQQLQLDPKQCVVVEDSRNGLLAAKAAGMRCLVTTNGYTENEDFAQADLVVAELGDPPNVKVTVQTLRDIVAR